MLGPFASVSLPLALMGCLTFPWADVRHSHAEVDLVAGATVVTVGAENDYFKQKAGYSHIDRGNRVVLLVMDSDAKPGWTDSGSGEFLLLEFPELREGGTWKIGLESRGWFWGGGAWSSWSAGGISGTVSAKSTEGASWVIRVDLACERGEVLRPAPAENELVSWHHTFKATPIDFTEFRRKYPPVTGWTK